MADFTKCDDDDPRRCKGINKYGQCRHLADEGSEFCANHGAHWDHKRRDKQLRRMYDLAMWQERMGELSEGGSHTSLAEELAIARLTLENIFRFCASNTDVVMHSSKIGDMLSRIEKLASTCHKLERETGMLLDKGAALRLGATMVEIISKYVKDEDILNAIGTEIAVAISKGE